MKKLLYVVLLTSLIICGCKQRDARISPSGNVVKIGVIAPMSGPNEKTGKNAILGILTAVRMQPYLNNGDKIDMLVKDNQDSPQQTLSALAELRGRNDVAGVILVAKSDAVLPLAPLADQYQIPLLALIATHPDITKNNQYITQLDFDDRQQGTVAALYIRDEILIDRVAVFSDPGNAHYSLLAKAFMHQYTAVGGKLVEHIPIETKSVDWERISGATN